MRPDGEVKLVRAAGEKQLQEEIAGREAAWLQERAELQASRRHPPPRHITLNQPWNAGSPRQASLAKSREAAQHHEQDALVAKGMRDRDRAAATHRETQLEA